MCRVVSCHMPCRVTSYHILSRNVVCRCRRHEACAPFMPRTRTASRGFLFSRYHIVGDKQRPTNGRFLVLAAPGSVTGAEIELLERRRQAHVCACACKAVYSCTRCSTFLLLVMMAGGGYCCYFTAVVLNGRDCSVVLANSVRLRLWNGWRRL